MVKKKKRKPRKHRTALWFFIFILLGVSALLWWLYPQLFPSSPQFNFLVIEKNDQPLKILKGETLRLNPKDRLRIKKLITNRFLNRGFRLFAGEFDVNAFRRDSLVVGDFLRDGDIFARYDYRIKVIFGNREIGYVDLVIEPDLTDWLSKADRMIDKDRKIALLEKALTQVPRDARIRERLVEAYKNRGKWSEAAAMLEKAAEEKPDEKVLQDLLEIYETMSNLDGQISVLTRMAEQNPEALQPRLQLASLLEENGKFGKAVTVYESLLDKMPKEESAPLYKVLGYLYTRTAQTEKAVAAYLKALELDQGDVNLYYNLAGLYEKSGQREKADIYLAKALSLKAEDVEGRLGLAERLIQSGKLETAGTYLDEVLKKEPNSLDALVLKATIAEKRQDKNALITLYGRILSLDPKNDTVLYNLGILEFETGRLNESLSYFKKYAARHPKDKETHAFLFEIYKRQEKKEQAFQEASVLSALEPGDSAPFDYMFEYLNKQGDYQRMIAVMQDGLKRNPGDIQLKEYLILALLKTGKKDQALKEIQDILKIRPKDVSLHLQAATLMEKQGNIDGAIESYQKILELSPGHKEAGKAAARLLLHKARNLEEQEKYQEALDLYQAVLKLSPDQEDAEEAYLRLRLRVLPGESKKP